MNMFKYELHAHTAEVSSCGHVDADALVQVYGKAGYQGLVITDHFHGKYLESLGSISWDEKIDRYLSGYRKAREEGLRINMDILWGLELRFTENSNDYLVYGLDEDFLNEHQDLHESNIVDFMADIGDRKDLLVFQAHPFRIGCHFVEPPIVHGLEIFNGNRRHDSRNHLAVNAARENDLLVISGSDFHRPEDLGSGGILVPERISTNAELVQALERIQYDSLLAGDLNHVSESKPV
jgi:predicted metal-dependent phosphoesterase TrpH